MAQRPRLLLLHFLLLLLLLLLLLRPRALWRPAADWPQRSILRIGTPPAPSAGGRPAGRPGTAAQGATRRFRTTRREASAARGSGTLPLPAGALAGQRAWAEPARAWREAEDQPLRSLQTLTSRRSRSQPALAETQTQLGGAALQQFLPGHSGPPEQHDLEHLGVPEQRRICSWGA